MPDLRTANNVLPIADAGERGIDDNPAGDMSWVLRSQCVAHHVADIMGKQVGLPNLEVVQHAGDIYSRFEEPYWGFIGLQRA